MRLAGSALVFALAPLAIVAACSSSSSSNSSAFIEQYCSLLRPCCMPVSTGQAGSGCVDFYSFFGGQVDRAKGDACLAEIHAHQNEMGFCANVGALTPSCDKAFSSSSSTGTKAPGETCQSSRDCAPSDEGKVRCGFVTTGAPGSTMTTSMCELDIDGKAGDMPCVGTKTGGVTITASPRAARGYVCNVANNVWCNEKTHACEATLKTGDACTFGQGEACGAGASCGSDNKCVANTPSSQPPAMDSSLLIVCSTKS